MALRFVLFGVLSVALLGADRPHVSSVAAERIALSSQALTRYASTHSLDDLGVAVDALSGTIGPEWLTSAEFVPTRRALTRAFANVLKQIEGAYEPNFDGTDPGNLPFLCAPMPPPLIGVGGCVPPEAVPDPVQRAAYIQSIKENDAKRARMSHFHDVRQLDDEAMTLLAVTLKFLNEISPGNFGSDYTALDKIVASAGISDARRRKIDSMMYDGMKR